MRQARESAGLDAPRDWSNRLLILALAGIFFLTMYPFEFAGHAKGIGLASPLLLGKGGKDGSARDIFLNILLFVPFGFALGTKLQKQGKSLGRALFYTVFGGALLSYTIEFLQLYIPQRDSGWEDVLTNSIGALVGFGASILLGRWLVEVLGDFEKASESRLTIRRIGFLLLIYFAAWFMASTILQKQTHLDDWFPESRLVIGNDAMGWHPWKGQVQLLEIWDRALPARVAKQLMNGAETPTEGAPLIKIESPSAGLNAPAGELVKLLKGSSHFSMRAVLRPPQVAYPNGPIVSISPLSGFPDLLLRQDGANLIFWLRNPVTIRRPWLDWKVPGVLKANQLCDVLFSYDDSELSIYVNHKRPEHDAMGPGTALASFIRRLKQNELKGYGYVYYVILFFPAGALLGIGLRKQFGAQIESLALLLLSVLLAPTLLEWVLMRANGRHFSFANSVFSAAMVIFGLFWMNSDSGRVQESRTGNRPV